MAKKRKIGEVVSNTAPKAPVSPDVTLGDQGKEVFPSQNKVKAEPKKKSLQKSAKEQNDFNRRYAFSADVNDSNYDNSPGEVPEEYANAVNSWSDYRMVPKMKQEDEVDVSGMSPQQAGNAIPQGANYTSPSASRSDKIYNNGFNIVDILRRKGYDSGTIFDESDRPTLDNPTGEGYRYIDKEMGKDNSEKMEKMPTKPAGKVDTKQGSALVNATKPTEKMEPMDTKKPEKVSLTIADQKASNPVDPNTTLGNQGKGIYDVSNDPAKKPVDPEVVLGNQGQRLIETISSDVKNTVSDKAILAQIQNAETPEEINQIKADAQAAKIEEEKIKSDAANQNVNAVQQLMSGINEELRGRRPAFDQSFTVGDIQNGIFNQYRNQTSQIPYAVVEKLGVQDYYPNVGRDIAVGTFSGSRIGSQTIYSGEGALLPMGLYDARKKALVDAAKTKQKKIDDFLKVPNAPDQFNSDFQQSAYSQLHDIGASHNWDLNAIMKDKDAMQRIYSIKNSAKELAYTDQIVDDAFESLNPKEGKTAAYIPDDVLQDMIDYRQGKLDVDAILSGKSDVLEIASRIRNYANGTAWADKNLPEWKSDPVSLPLNLRTDKEITMENLNEMNQAIEKAKISGSYDSYMTAVKKYFHLDPEVVDAWVEQNMVGATPEQKQKVIDDLNSYILAQMPPASLEQKIENLKNDNYNYWAKRGDWARQDKEKETLITRAINTANEKNIKGVISQIGNSNMTVAQKEAAMLQAYRNAGFTPVKNRSTGEIYGTINYGGAGRRGENATFTTDRSEVYLYNNTTKKYEWVNPGYALANRSKFSLKESELNELKNFQKGNALGTISETRTFETFIGTDGKPRKVSAANAKDFSNSGDQSLMMESHGNILVEGSGKDKNGAPILVPGTLKVRVALNPEKSVADRDLLDSFHMDRSQKLATDPGFDQGTTSSNFK